VRRIEDALGRLTSFFVRTNPDYRRFNYIGEWHSHPIFELEPSFKDDASMMEILLDPAVGARSAEIFAESGLIGGGIESSHVIAAGLMLAAMPFTLLGHGAIRVAVDCFDE
jgi:hypothetical protein